VLLDLVVRDKRERLVSDLKAQDVDVYGDGVKQTPKSFQLATGREQTATDERAKAAQTGTAQPAPGLSALREIDLASIVCRRMRSAAAIPPCPRAPSRPPRPHWFTKRPWTG
jgi:hypothetical protein